MKNIPVKEYSKITKVLPVLCVDIIIQNSKREYLLVKRLNEPKKNKWWVVGGRVQKGESLSAAVRRKVKQETGILVSDMRALGYFELLKGRNPFGLSGKYHTVSVVFLVKVNSFIKVKLDSQSAGYKFFKNLPPDFCVKPF